MSRQIMKALGILLAVCFLISTASAASCAVAKASSTGEKGLSMDEKGLCKEKKYNCEQGQSTCIERHCHLCCGGLYIPVAYNGNLVPCGTRGLQATCPLGGTYRLNCPP